MWDRSQKRSTVTNHIELKGKRMSSSGHYWTYLKHPRTQLWWKVNDDERDEIGTLEEVKDRIDIERKGVIYLYL